MTHTCSRVTVQVVGLEAVVSCFCSRFDVPPSNESVEWRFLVLHPFFCQYPGSLFGTITVAFEAAQGSLYVTALMFVSRLDGFNGSFKGYSPASSLASGLLGSKESIKSSVSLISMRVLTLNSSSVIFLVSFSQSVQAIVVQMVSWA